MHKACLSFLTSLCVAAPVGAALAAPYSFQTITIPNGQVGSITGINDVGQISGNYVAGTGYYQGFIETLATGTVIPLANNGFFTIAEGINNSGLVGGYTGRTGGTLGIVANPVTGVNTVLSPGAGGTGLDGFAAYGINDAGQVVGNSPRNYHTTNADVSFLYDPTTMTSSTVVDPAAGTGSGYMSAPKLYGYTHAYDINNRGQIVGAAYTVGGTSTPISPTTDGQTGFLLDLATNTYSVIDVPGSTATSATGINDNGQVVGTYQLGAVGYGFLYTLSTGLYTTLTDPGVTSISPDGINNAGQIVGSFADSTGTQTGFIASPNGTATVPEPASIALLGCGIGALVLVRRRGEPQPV